MSVKKELITLRLEEIIPYENNPRDNDEAVPDVAESMRQCGELDPIEVDENNVILAGHTRLKALIQRGRKQTEVVRYHGLTEEQKIKYRLLNNKTSEKARWLETLLDEERAKVDFDGYDFGFDHEELFEEAEDEKYTMKVNIPQYEPTGEKPTLAQMLDTNKADSLIARIEEAEGITDEERAFLIQAARRHNVFNYRNCAEYYAQATPAMQKLMEDSALVIIDVDNAIANGYARLSDEITAMLDDELEDQGGG